MTFTSSLSPDMTEPIPGRLAGDRLASKSQRGRVRWDITIGGIGFNLGVDDQHPYIRESAPVQKNQFDASQEAGEQTLDGYWIRSQTSWHLGAGINFYEPGAREGAAPTQYRFAESAGVDPWTEGQLTLLRKCDMEQADAGTQHVAGAIVSGADAHYSVVAGKLYRGGVAYTNPASGAPASRVAVAGAKVLVGTGTAIASGPVAGSALTDLWTGAPSAPVPYWAKSRVVAACGSKLFELTLAGGAWPATSLYDHPDTGWTWTGVAETPSAILASGYSSGVSAIYSFTLEADTGGATPKLGQPFQVAEFPPGEEVHAIRAYLGAYLGIGTSRGLRVGIIGDNGHVQYGPLLFETASPVRALAARDRFLYAGVQDVIDGRSGCARVDLGNQIGDGLVFPYAWDAQAHVTGAVTSLAFHGVSDRVVMAVQGSGVYVQSATDPEPSGWLRSGGVRYGTTEGKSFRYADLRCDTVNGGAVGFSIQPSIGGDLSIVTAANGADASNLSLAAVPQRIEYVSYTLTLTAPAGISPVVESVALKALPSVRKQRMIQYPVLFQEKQQDGSRQPVRMDVPGTLARLEGLEESQTVVQVEDYRIGESYPGTIESFQFSGTTPSSARPGSGNNVGGRGQITIRRV